MKVFRMLKKFINWIKRDVTEKQLYAYEFSDGTIELYVYMERWNICGHRYARQDWWAKVIQTKSGKFRQVGKFEKYNVGYGRPERKGLPWCHPYRKASNEDIGKSIH